MPRAKAEPRKRAREDDAATLRPGEDDAATLAVVEQLVAAQEKREVDEWQACTERPESHVDFDADVPAAFSGLAKQSSLSNL